MRNGKFNKIIGAGVTGVGALLAYLFVIRPWHLCWGLTDDEVSRSLPGDELVPQPKQKATRAMTIQAPASDVWPWLVQLGQGRGGLYSYDWLENLIGCDIHNADRIMPEFQHLQVGDPVRLGPEGYPFYTVAAIEPERALILHAADPQIRGHNESWVFYLEPINENVTRLIVRNRRDYKPSLANFVMWQVITEPAHFIMERKMLLGIRQRVEAAVSLQPVAAGA